MRGTGRLGWLSSQSKQPHSGELQALRQAPRQALGYIQPPFQFPWALRLMGGLLCCNSFVARLWAVRTLRAEFFWGATLSKSPFRCQRRRQQLCEDAHALGAFGHTSNSLHCALVDPASFIHRQLPPRWKEPHRVPVDCAHPHPNPHTHTWYPQHPQHGSPKCLRCWTVLVPLVLVSLIRLHTWGTVSNQCIQRGIICSTLFVCLSGPPGCVHPRFAPVFAPVMHPGYAPVVPLLCPRYAPFMLPYAPVMPRDMGRPRDAPRTRCCLQELPKRGLVVASPPPANCVPVQIVWDGGQWHSRPPEEREQ